MKDVSDELSKSIPISQVDVSGNIERSQKKLLQITSTSRPQTPLNLSGSSYLSGSSQGDASLLNMKQQKEQLMRVQL